MTKVKTREITIRVPERILAEIAEEAVEEVLVEFSEAEIKRAGIKRAKLIKQLLAEADWGRELEAGLVDYLDDLAIDFGRAVGYKTYSTPVLKHAVRDLAEAAEALGE